MQKSRISMELELQFIYFWIIYSATIANILKYLTFVKQPNIFKSQNVKSVSNNIIKYKWISGLI